MQMQSQISLINNAVALLRIIIAFLGTKLFYSCPTFHLPCLSLSCPLGLVPERASQVAPHDDEAGGQEWRPGERKGGHVTGPGQLQRSQSVVHDERAPQSPLDGLATESASAGQCNIGAEAVVVECSNR